MIEEDAVPLLHGAEVLLRKRIADARPRCPAVVHQVVVAVVRGFFLEEPVHAANLRRTGRWRLRAAPTLHAGGVRVRIDGRWKIEI